MSKNLEKILRLRERQMVNNGLKSVLHVKQERFFDLFSEIRLMTRPSFGMPQVAWDFWTKEIMPMFLDGDSLHILDYEIRII